VASINTISDFECGLDRIEVSMQGFPAPGLDSLQTTSTGSVLFLAGGTTVEIANHFGVSDFATKVWESFDFV
jgi:hypothetical protein